jgi:type I restriction enzyme S subunit
MTYQAYPEYKPSGIDWLGEVPEHWEIKRAKYMFILAKRPINDNDEIVTAFRDGEVTLRSNRRTTGFTNALQEIGYQGIKNGDLVIHAMDAFAGAIGVSDSDGKCSPVYSCCIPKKNIDNYFYARMLRTMALNGYIQSLAKGIRERSTEFRWSDFKEQYLSVPSIEEQQFIVKFLDTETTRIDKLIKEKEHFIELLEEKRQALITHVVTKGLDPNTTMTSSGNEWLGDVPEHWTVKRMKFVIHLNPSKAEVRHLLEKSIDVSFLPMELVNEDGTYQLTETRNINEVYSGFTYCMNDDVILAKITPCFENGKGALLKGLTNSIAFGSTEFHVLRPISSVGKFIWYLTKTNLFGEIGKTEMKGAVGQQRIPSDFVENFYFAQPSLDEQQDIVDYLDTETKKIDDIIKETSHSIDLLKEHRTALISAAVTGKIDVRHLVKEAA